MPRRPLRLRLVLAVTALVPLALTLAGGLPTARAATSPGPVILVGTGGVQWADVTPAGTPALASLPADGAIGDVAVRSVRRSACPVDGWLAVSSGRRAADTAVDAAHSDVAACRPVRVSEGTVPGGSASVLDWQRYLDAAAAEKFDARLGLLGQALQDAGVCATAVGPGAAVALARPDGTVQRYRPTSALTQALRPGECPLTVVDAGAVRDPADASEGAAEQGVAVAAADRAAQVRAVDDVIGQVLQQAPENARVIVVSLADAGATPHLQLIAARGPGFGPGWLRTASTRQVALVQATDLTPTLLSLLDVDSPAGLVGSPLQTLSVASGEAPRDVQARLRKVADLEQAAQEVQSLVAPFFNGLVVAQLLLYGAAAIVLRRSWASGRRRVALLRAVRRIALVFATVPVATYLANTVPWWRTGHALLTVVGVVAAYVVVLSVVAQLGPWRRWLLGPFGAVAGLTSIVLAVDIMTGSRLQTSSLMGLQPVVAGRFYGFSNVAFALFATGALLLAVAVGDGLVRAGRRHLAGAAVALIGVVATALDVAPRWGSDFGGPLGLVPAFAVLTLLVLGVRLSWRKVVLIGVGTVALLAAVSVADWMRPAAQRTHLGRFVQTVIDGGAWDVIARKGEQNLSILFGSVLSILVPVAALFVTLVLMRPSSWGVRALARAYDRSPTLRHGLICLMLLLGIGFAVNDSGTAIPAVGFTLAIPLVIAASLRALEDDSGATAATAPARPDPAAVRRPPTAPPLDGSPA